MATPELMFYLRSLTRFVYFVTDEEDRFLVRLKQALKEHVKRAWVYNAAFGLVSLESLVQDWENRTHTENTDTLNIHAALVQMYKDDPKREQNFYVVTDPERWLADAHVQRRFLNLAHQVNQDDRTIKIVIFVGSRKFVPEKLSRYIEVIHDKGLTNEEILQLVENAAKHLSTPVPEDSAKLFKGLTSYEVKMAIGQSIIATKKDKTQPRRIDPAIISDFRRKQLRKSDLVQYIDTDSLNFNDVGGADRFKTWARKTKATWTDQGQKFGLKPPKGVLCVGVWGCIAEGSRLEYKRGERKSAGGRSLLIEDFYEKFNGIKGQAHSAPPWIPGIPTYLQSWDAVSGCLVYNEVTGVHDTGVKECLRIITDCAVLELTANHPVLMADGTFCLAGDIQPGAKVLVRGGMKLTSKDKKRVYKERVIIDGLKYHPTAYKKRVTDKTSGVVYEYGRSPRARLVFEARMNNLSFDEFVKILKENPEIAETLAFLPVEYDVHHMDENTLNDVPGNLMVMTHESHARHHWNESPIHANREFTRESTVISVTPIGMKRTFDVSMGEPCTNFVVNDGPIVHNCGKSLSVKALGSAWDLPVVQLEMGRLRSSGVGDSEANVYRACRIIESAAPCVTGETEVTLADGSIQPIEAIWQSYVVGGDSLSVQCWNEKTLKATTTTVKAVTRRKALAFSVKAVNGFSLNATANHLHYVMRGGMPEWVPTDELQSGYMLAVPTARYDGNPDCQQFHPPGMRSYEKPNGTVEMRRGGGGFRDAVITALPSKWSTQLGWLLGAMEGDGFLGLRDGIGFTNTDERLLKAFENCLHEQFGLTAVRRLHENQETPDLPGLSNNPSFKPCWTSVVTNQLAAEFLRNARIAILTAPPQVRAAFFAGWLDADGCVSPAKVTLTVKDPRRCTERRRLARQIVQSLGVVPSKFNTCNMEVTGPRAVALAALVGEFLISKQDKARSVKSSDIGFDRGMGFACGALLTEARTDSRLLHIQLQKHFSSSITWGHENGHVMVSERHLEKYADVFPQFPEFKRLLDADCRWVRIDSIENIGEHDVFDLVCEGEDTHSFFANGLVTHNCIVWVDEAEKSLSGGQSSAQSDAGTTSRTIGILSTWLQETDAQVCLAMTANSLKTLPIEFINRMDERFFFDLPGETDRIDILKIHLRKAGQDPDLFDLAMLAEKATGMVGREIEQAIGAAMIESFAQNKPRLDQGILADALSGKPRIIKTMADEVKEVIEWVGYDEEINEGIRARFASNPDRKSGSLKLIRNE
jgi:SpoVK/Ycf46/Vps4 family AAA+-type ATPase